MAYRKKQKGITMGIIKCGLKQTVLDLNGYKKPNVTISYTELWI